MNILIKLQLSRIVKGNSPSGGIILPGAQIPADPAAGPWTKFAPAAYNRPGAGQTTSEVITLSKKNNSQNKTGNQNSQNKSSNQSNNQNGQSSQNSQNRSSSQN